MTRVDLSSGTPGPGVPPAWLLVRLLLVMEELQLAADTARGRTQQLHSFTVKAAPPPAAAARPAAQLLWPPAYSQTRDCGARVVTISASTWHLNNIANVGVSALCQ